MTTVWLIRHGHTVMNGRCYAGRADVPLAPEGRAQARAIAAHLADQCLDVILSSPLHRARLGRSHGLPVSNIDGSCGIRL